MYHVATYHIREPPEEFPTPLPASDTMPGLSHRALPKPARLQPSAISPFRDRHPTIPNARDAAPTPCRTHPHAPSARRQRPFFAGALS